MDRSKLSDKSERYSIVSEYQNHQQPKNNDVSQNKGLRENKSMVNYRPNGTPNVKKQ